MSDNCKQRFLLLVRSFVHVQPDAGLEDYATDSQCDPTHWLDAATREVTEVLEIMCDHRPRSPCPSNSSHCSFAAKANNGELSIAASKEGNAKSDQSEQFEKVQALRTQGRRRDRSRVNCQLTNKA